MNEYNVISPVKYVVYFYVTTYRSGVQCPTSLSFVAP